MSKIDDGSESLQLKRDAALLKDVTFDALYWGLRTPEHGEIITLATTGEVIKRQPLDTLGVHDLAALRGIIGEVISDGSPTDSGCWKLTTPDERNLFIEMVFARIISTAVPGVAGEGGQ